MKRLFTVVLVLALMLVPATTFADTTYFEDNFESYTPDIGFFPPVYINGSIGDFATDVRTQNGSNMLYISSESVSGSPAIAMVKAPFTINPNETQLTLSFTFMSELSDDYLILFFGVPDKYIAPIVFSDGSASDYFGNPIIAPPGTIQPGVYYDVKIVINLVANTFDIYIDNTLLTSNVPLITAGLDSGNVLAFYSVDYNSNNGLAASAYIDNIMLTGLYTEPAVNPRTGETANYTFVYVLITMLAMGFAGLVIRRKLVKKQIIK